MQNKIIRTEFEALQFLNSLEHGQLLAFDLETDGLAVRTGNITDIALYDGTTAYNIVHKEYVNGALLEVVPYALCKQVIERLRECQLRCWNGSFDARFTHGYFGVDLAENIYEDGMLLAHTISENEFNYGLKETASRIFGAHVINEKADMVASIKANGGSPKEFYKADSNLRALYACNDVRLTWNLIEHFLLQLKADGLEDFFEREVMQLYRTVTIPMERLGVPIDLPYLQSTQAEMTTIMNELQDNIQAAIAPLLGPFNKWYIEKNYKFELNARFKQKLGELIAPELWPKTDTGKLSFSKVDIERAKALTKTETKKGLTRPLLNDGSQFEQIISGNVRCPKDLIVKVQIALMQEDGLKYNFNILSKDNLKRLFFGTSTTPSLLKEKALSFTDKGSPQIDDDFLESVKNKYDWVPLLQRYNSLTKIKSTYVDRFLEEQENGIFYPSFYQHRTTSGRYSGDLQQLPRTLEAGEGDEIVREYTNRIRRFFISGPDKVFCDFDYDSQEVKVFAHVSGEQSIKDVFANGDDFYSSVCISAEGLQGFSANKQAPNYLGKVNKPARQRAKAYALGLAFGMTPYKLKFELNCSEQEAQRIYDNYFRAYPKLKQWLDDSKRKACIEGFVRTEAGRVRRFPELKAYYAQYGDVLFDGLKLWKEYNETPDVYSRLKAIAGICKNLVNNAANVQIQGLAASITNRAAIKTAKALKAAALQGYICNITHDQITVLCPDSEREQVCAILQESMETAYEISVKLTAPPSWGRNLAESK